MANTINRRNFLKTMGLMTGGLLINPAMALSGEALPGAKGAPIKKKRVAMIGTGHRGTGMWGTPVVNRYPERVEFVGLCDPNAGRVETAKKMMKVDCPTYTDFEKMMKETKPDLLIVTTVDAFHHQYIVRGMELGADIITEKPMTTDEFKCQEIIDAEKKYGKKVIVTFNYRYSPHRQKIWELLRAGEIGEVTSADFHWYLDTRHGADYFRRWHRRREFGGSLWVHKSTHHFDLLNYWLDTEPEEVFAYGALEFYGKNGPYRSTTCRACDHKRECKFYWDVEANPRLKALYVDNEQYDGYHRDGCVFREDVDIFDKMAATIKYANGVQVSYSLTTYSPYEGYRIAFNGTKGRLDAWVQESNPSFNADYDEIVVTKDFGIRDYYRVSHNAGAGGHGGGGYRVLDKIFLDLPEDPYKQSAGVRDGAFSILTGVAARNSCDTGKPVKIADLTSLKPLAKKA